MTYEMLFRDLIFDVITLLLAKNATIEIETSLDTIEKYTVKRPLITRIFP